MSKLRELVQSGIRSFEGVKDHLRNLLRNPELDDFEIEALEELKSQLDLIYESFTDRVILEAHEADPEDTNERMKDIPDAQETMDNIRSRVIARLRSRGGSIDPGVLLSTLGKDDPIH